MTPLFPLPNVVLFPNVFLPLHIFEDRYRAMVKDALATDRVIGMVLLRGSHDAATDSAPPIYPVGCSGLITHAEPLPDGHFNIVLRGLEKFRVMSEAPLDATHPYRRACVEPIPDTEQSDEGLRVCRQQIEQLLDDRLLQLGPDSRIPQEMADGDVVNALSQYLELEPVEKQALLECNSLGERCQALAELLEIRAMMERVPAAVSTIQ